MNIQILNIKTGTIKIKKQLAYTKTLQMALHMSLLIFSKFPANPGPYYKTIFVSQSGLTKLFFPE